MSTPLFPTRHAPVGAWSSFTFGGAGRGTHIEHHGGVQRANLLIAIEREGVITALPFIETTSHDSRMHILAPDKITRTLTPCIDEFAAPDLGLTFRVFTPHTALPNPKRSGNLQYATVPGLLAELLIDNTTSDLPATAFVGLGKLAGGHLRPLDWSSKTLCGIADAGDWLLAAAPVKNEIFTIQAQNFPQHLDATAPIIEAHSPTGGILIKVPPRTSRAVNLVFAFHNGGSATQGIHSRYLYTAYFQRIEMVANFILQNHQKIRESCASFDTRIAAACTEEAQRSLFAHAVRDYEGRTQLTDAEGVPYFTSITDGYRNALSHAVDNLPWELFRNPWVIRNIFDLGTTSYSYQDQVRFPADTAAPGELRAGGLTFTHDSGLDSCYAPTATSASEIANQSSVRSFTSTESLLDGIYLLTSYALLAEDTPWSKTRLPFARELLTSMENRDHWDPPQRNGILKAQSEKVGPDGAETTAYAGIAHSLETVPGNLALAVKTFCANLMLTTYFQGNNDLHSADYAYAFAQKTAATLIAAVNRETGALPPNLLDPTIADHMIAALEPLAVPTYLGLTSTLAEYFPELFAILKSHALACLSNGCIDVAIGGLRLTSSTEKTIPAKVISILYVLERLFDVDLQTTHPNLWKTLDPAITAALFLKQKVAPGGSPGL